MKHTISSVELWEETQQMLAELGDVPATISYQEDWDIDGIEIQLLSVISSAGEELIGKLLDEVQEIEWELSCRHDDIEMEKALKRYAPHLLKKKDR